MDTVDGEFAAYEKAIVIRQHQRPDDSNQLQLREGEIVYVVEKDPSGWWGGHKDGEKDPGWFPADSVRILPAEVSFESHAVATPPSKADSTTPPNFGIGQQQQVLQSTQTNHRSPVRGNTHIASPQRGLDFSAEAHQQNQPQQLQQHKQQQQQQPSSLSPAHSPPPQQQEQSQQNQQNQQKQQHPKASFDESASEVERLRQENDELKRQVRHCKRQSDMDRERLERELERVRQQKEQLEDLVSEQQQMTMECSTSTGPEEAAPCAKIKTAAPAAGPTAGATATATAARGAAAGPTAEGSRARSLTPPRSGFLRQKGQTATKAGAAATTTNTSTAKQTQEPQNAATTTGPHKEGSQADLEASHSSRVTDVTEDEIPPLGTVKARVSLFNTMGSRSSIQQPETTAVAKPQQQRQQQQQQQQQQQPPAVQKP